MSLDIKIKLSDYNITKECIEKVINGLKEKGLSNPSEAEEMGVTEMQKIFELSL